MPSEEQIVHLTRRKSSRDYWRGYRDGIQSCRDALQRSLDHLDEVIISQAQEDNGIN
jgi:hypothetical protein